LRKRFGDFSIGILKAHGLEEFMADAFAG